MMAQRLAILLENPGPSVRLKSLLIYDNASRSRWDWKYHTAPRQHHHSSCHLVANPLGKSFCWGWSDRHTSSPTGIHARIIQCLRFGGSGCVESEPSHAVLGLLLLNCDASSMLSFNRRVDLLGSSWEHRTIALAISRFYGTGPIRGKFCGACHDTLANSLVPLTRLTCLSICIRNSESIWWVYDLEGSKDSPWNWLWTSSRATG